MVVGGEAMLPAFVAADPYGAGVAGGPRQRQRPGGDGRAPGRAARHRRRRRRTSAARCCAGMRWAASSTTCPIVGGHLTRSDGPPALSAFGIGRADARAVGDARGRRARCSSLGCCIEGEMRADFLFFPSFDERGGRLAGDVRLLAELAESGRRGGREGRQHGRAGRVARRCCSSPTGSASSVDLDRLPVPDGVALGDWLACFPCFAFLLTCPPDRVEDVPWRAFRGRGLAAAADRRPRRHRPGAARGAAGTARGLRPRPPKAVTQPARLSGRVHGASSRSAIDIGWCGTPR